MTLPTPEQLFARFRDAGDVSALAVVFDALAGQLLLVAGHLVRDGALAEDLVQTTFVEAMRSAQRYDARRPLLPWLVRILTHHARKQQRRQRREQALRAPASVTAPSALAAVLDQEALATIQAGLVELPVPYQQVLNLRLVHDLSPTAIAHALGCSPETVKTRLRRGLERLRRQLPAGIASALALVLFAGRGLAAMRSEVLRIAAHGGGKVAAGGVAVGVGFLGGALMKQWLLRTTVAVVVVAMGCTFATDWLGGSASSPVAGGPPAVLAKADSVGNGEVVAAAERTSALASLAPEVVFRGRCIDATNGQPLAGVRGHVRIESEGRALPEYELVGIRPDGQTVADGLGVFRVACALTADATYAVNIGNREHVQRVRSFGPFTAAREIDLGDVALQTGVLVRTRVVDRSGRVAAGVAFGLSQRRTIGRNDSLMQRAWLILRTDRDGLVDWPFAMPAGQYMVSWDLERVAPERQYDWIVIPEAASHEHTLVWPVEDVRQTIRGRVLDEHGRGVEALALIAEGAGTRGYATTVPEGAFRIARIGPFDPHAIGPVHFGLSEPAGDFELVDGPAGRWGDGEVLMQVRRAVGFSVRAVDSRTGAALQSFDIACAAVPDDGGQPVVVWGRPGARVRHPDDSLRVSVAARPHVVQVFPADPEFAPSAKVRWDPREGNTLTVPVTSTRMGSVRVVDAAGAAVAGSEVWTLRPIEALDGPHAAADWREVSLPVAEELRLDPTQRWARHGIDDAPIDCKRTGADGRVRLRLPSDVDVVIAALGPGHRPLALVGRATADEEVVLRVQAGAGLRVVVTPADVVARLGRSTAQRRVSSDAESQPTTSSVELRVNRVAREQDPAHWQQEMRSTITEAGRFECHGLAPGSYDLAFTGNLRSGPGDGILVWWPFQTITLRDGEVRELTVDASRWRTGRLQGQVLVNGQPWCWGNGMLIARQEQGDTSMEVGTDGDGRFDVEIGEGSYRLHMDHRPVFNHGYWYAEESHQVVPGSVTQAVFTARCIAATVRITHSDGKPAVGVTATMTCSTEPRGWKAWTTDADGRLVIEPAPRVPFSLTVASTSVTGTIADRLPGAPRDALLGPFQVPPQGDRVEFTAELPEGWR